VEEVERSEDPECVIQVPHRGSSDLPRIRAKAVPNRAKKSRKWPWTSGFGKGQAFRRHGRHPGSSEKSPDGWRARPGCAQGSGARSIAKVLILSAPAGAPDEVKAPSGHLTGEHVDSRNCRPCGQWCALGHAAPRCENLPVLWPWSDERKGVDNSQSRLSQTAGSDQAFLASVRRFADGHCHADFDRRADFGFCLPRHLSSRVLAGQHFLLLPDDRRLSPAV
jgi:hypothetical protein